MSKSWLTYAQVATKIGGTPPSDLINTWVTKSGLITYFPNMIDDSKLTGYGDNEWVIDDDIDKKSILKRVSDFIFNDKYPPNGGSKIERFEAEDGPEGLITSQITVTSNVEWLTVEKINNIAQFRLIAPENTENISRAARVTVQHPINKSLKIELSLVQYQVGSPYLIGGQVRSTGSADILSTPLRDLYINKESYLPNIIFTSEDPDYIEASYSATEKLWRVSLNNESTEWKLHIINMQHPSNSSIKGIYQIYSRNTKNV